MFEDIEITDRPRAHLPVAIVIDKSKSMEDVFPIINRRVRELIQQMKEELTLKGIVDLLIVFYSGHIYQGPHGNTPPVFQPLDRVDPKRIDFPECKGHTDTGKALLYAIKALENKKMECQRLGEEYCQPLLFLLTDGFPDPGIGAPPEAVERVRKAYQDAAEAIREMEDAEKLTFVAAGIQRRNSNYKADMETLRKLSRHRERIVSITEDDNMQGISKFFKVIYAMTDNAENRDNTPVGAVVNRIFK